MEKRVTFIDRFKERAEASVKKHQEAIERHKAARDESSEDLKKKGIVKPKLFVFGVIVTISGFLGLLLMILFSGC